MYPPPIDPYDPKPLDAFGEAFDACVVLEARDLFRDFEGACELKTALSQKLMTLAAERDRTHCASRVGLESLPLN